MKQVHAGGGEGDPVDGVRHALASRRHWTRSRGSWRGRRVGHAGHPMRIRVAVVGCHSASSWQNFVLWTELNVQFYYQNGYSPFLKSQFFTLVAVSKICELRWWAILRVTLSSMLLPLQELLSVKWHAAMEGYSPGVEAPPLCSTSARGSLPVNQLACQKCQWRVDHTSETEYAKTFRQW